MYIKQNKLEHQRIDKNENQNNKTYTIIAMAEEGLLISDFRQAGRQAGRQADKQTNRCA